MTGVGYLPITGGLLLGDDDREGGSDRFPISQDQRHTVRGRAGYDLTSRTWVALAGSFGSGLPVEPEGDLDAAVEQYGPNVVSRGSKKWALETIVVARRVRERSAGQGR